MLIRQAPLAVTFAIVGGGIGGLACAYSLARHGHIVHIFEREKGKHQRSSGIRVPPNLYKLLREWGLDDELAKALKTYRSDFHHANDDEHQGFLLWQQDVLQEAGGDFCTMHWGELYQILYSLATSAGATINFGANVTSVEGDENDNPVLTFADGTTFIADVVVGADGSKSKIREIVNSQASAPRRGCSESDMTVYSITVPSEMLSDDPDFRKRVVSPKGQFTLWTSDRKWLIGYPIRMGKEYCIHANWHGEFSSDEDVPDWGDIVPSSSIDFGGCHPMFERIFSMVPDVMRSIYHPEIVEDWVDDETGRIVLVAEAAHPNIPLTIHSQSLAIEDSVVLGTLFSRISRWDQIPQLLDGFQELRQDRCHFVHNTEVSTAAMLSLPPGDQREERDANLRSSLIGDETWDESQLQSQWEGISIVFGYNAREDAENWWIKWGLLDHRVSVFDMTNFGVQVQEVQEHHSDE